MEEFIYLFIIGLIGFYNYNYELSFIKNITKNISIPRPVESKNLMKVKSYIKKIIKEIGLKITEQKFTKEINSNQIKMSNIIGINNKSKGPYILLGAHIDSNVITNPLSKSAIDSASAIAIILQLCDKILESNPNFPIAIVFFDGEEAIDGKWTNDTTLSGSKYFVENFNLDLISKTYIFDLIGGDTDKNKISSFLPLPNTFDDINTMSKINKKLYGPDDQIFQSTDEFIAKNMPEDDHLPFVEKNKWVCNLIPYKFPDQHHKINDTYDNVNWNYVNIFYNVMYKFLTENTNY
jgi:hypothetical protein